MDEVLVDVEESLVLSLLPFVAIAKLDHVDVCPFLERVGVGSDPWDIGIVDELAEPEEIGLEDIRENVDNFVTESVDIDATVFDNLDFFGSKVFEDIPMNAW